MDDSDLYQELDDMLMDEGVIDAWNPTSELPDVHTTPRNSFKIDPVQETQAQGISHRVKYTTTSSLEREGELTTA